MRPIMVLPEQQLTDADVQAWLKLHNLEPGEVASVILDPRTLEWDEDGRGRAFMRVTRYLMLPNGKGDLTKVLSSDENTVMTEELLVPLVALPTHEETP